MSTPAVAEPVQRQAEEDELQMKPLASSITPLVQREAAPEEEDELQAKPIQREMDPEAEEPIQTKLLQREAMPEEEETLQTKSTGRSPQATDGTPDLETRLSQSQGSGSPLPKDTQQFMESRFGTDFSHVKVHTGSEAVQMNREIGAQAFTHGSNVYFGAGKFDPGSASGRHLLAHELTHVVQQTGHISPRRTQESSQKTNKQELGPAQIAKNIAPSDVQTSTKKIRRVATPLIQAYRERVSVPSMGTGIDPSTVQIDHTYGSVYSVPDSVGIPSPGYLGFEGRRIENSTLPEGSTGGRVEFNTFESADINNAIFNDIQWGSWHGAVPFTTNGDQVSFGSPLIDSQTGGSGATMSVSVGSGATPSGGYVTFSLMVAASGSLSMGGGIGVGPISASAPVTATTNFSGGFIRSFTVNLRTTPPQPIVGPDVTFRVGSAQLEDGQEGIIARWFQTLPESAQDAVRNGRRTISISGYASTTGRRGRNRNLSEQRARVVERILRGHAGSNASLNIFYFGEDNATTPDEREDPQWRRATVVAQAPSRTGPQLPGAAAP
uniref:DUF4157 domain-containing protein n=1 Tax=Oscillatoriales cyanobacterium SpSt-418 TaxID=2282169 RepID=A0A7C3PBY7_9CYAN